MSKTVEETRRALFNAALENRQVARDKSGLESLTRGEVSQSWWAFNAALDAVVITLPEWPQYDDDFTPAIRMLFDSESDKKSKEDKSPK